MSPCIEFIEIYILGKSYEKIPRRQEWLFKFKPIDFRLKRSEHTLPFAGEKLYNPMCNLINASTESDELEVLIHLIINLFYSSKF